MRRFWPILPLVAIFFIALWQTSDTQQPDVRAKQSPSRIISLAPSITETLYAVGAGEQLVAATNYCVYPEAAKALPKVGGYLDPSLAQIIAMQPELIVMSKRQTTLIKQLSQAGINVLTIDNTRLDGILQSILQIGKATGNSAQAQQLHQQIQQKITDIQLQVSHHPPKKTLLAIAHYTNSEQLDLVYLAGQKDFYNDILQLAGGENVYRHGRLKVPTVSLEGILRLNPEVIIDIFPDASAHQADLQQVRQQWQQLHHLQAVQTQNIHIIEADYATVPGPRIVQLLRDIAVRLHPELIKSAND